jgi:hypothetical protein
MCYYTYKLDKESADICIIVTPFGKYCYKQLPMGIKQSPDFAQEIIEEVLCGLDECKVYNNKNLYLTMIFELDLPPPWS